MEDTWKKICSLHDDAEKSEKEGRHKVCAEVLIEIIKESYRIVGSRDCALSMLWQEDQRMLWGFAEEGKTEAEKQIIRDSWSCRLDAISCLWLKVADHLNVQEKAEVVHFLHALLLVPQDDQVIERILCFLRKNWNEETVRLIAVADVYRIPYDLKDVYIERTISFGYDKMAELWNAPAVDQMLVHYRNVPDLLVMVSEILRQKDDEGIRKWLLDLSASPLYSEPERKAARMILDGYVIRKSTLQLY